MRVDERPRLRYNDSVKKWMYGITLMVALLSHVGDPRYGFAHLVVAERLTWLRQAVAS